MSNAEAPDKVVKRSKWTKAALTLDGLQTAVERARKRLAKNPELIAELERLGRERALIYKTLVLTGLRKGELASLSVGQLELDGTMPFVELEAADEKNREGSTIPLRADLVNDLRIWSSDTPKPSTLRLRKNETVATASNHCSEFPPGWCGSSTATFRLQESRRRTNAAGRSTFTPCEPHSEHFSAKGELLHERHKPRCDIRQST